MKQNNKQNNMKRAALFSGAITAIIVAVFSLAYITASAANKFPFSGRGIVKSLRADHQAMNITFSQMSDRAKDLALGSTLEVQTNQAKIYKPDATGKLRRVRLGNIAAGDEVSVTGQVRSDDRFVANKIVARDRSFSIKGELLTYSYANKKMTVQVLSSTYRPKDFNGGVVTITFPGEVQFYHLGATVEPKDVTASNQKVRVDGKVTNTDEFEATKMWENIP